jgi:hypothetical protein
MTKDDGRVKDALNMSLMGKIDAFVRNNQSSAELF